MLLARGSQRLLRRGAPRNDDLFFVIASAARRSPEVGEKAPVWEKLRVIPRI
jgi:hypothetical protein